MYDPSYAQSLASSSDGPALASYLTSNGFPDAANQIFELWLTGKKGTGFYLDALGILKSLGGASVVGSKTTPSDSVIDQPATGAPAMVAQGGQPVASWFTDLLPAIGAGVGALVGAPTVGAGLGSALGGVLGGGPTSPATPGYTGQGSSPGNIEGLIQAAIGALGGGGNVYGSGNQTAYGPATGAPAVTPPPTYTPPSAGVLPGTMVGKPRQKISYIGAGKGQVVVSVPYYDPRYTWAVNSGAVVVTAADGVVYAKLSVPKNMARSFGWKPAPKPLITASERKTLAKAQRLKKKFAKAYLNAGVSPSMLAEVKKKCQ